MQEWDASHGQIHLQAVSDRIPGRRGLPAQAYAAPEQTNRLACPGLEDFATGNHVFFDLEVCRETVIISRKVHYFEKGRMMPLEVKIIYKDRAFLLHLKQNECERIIPEMDLAIQKLDELTDRLFEFQGRRFLS